MDFHKFDHVTIEDVRKAHLADLATQGKYGVKYYQFWVNEEEGTVFCLMEGPDAETCALVHRLAHGNVACAISEVEPGFFKLAMGGDNWVDEGLTVKGEGRADLGYRSMLLVAITGFTRARGFDDLDAFQIPHWARDVVHQNTEKFRGRKVPWPHDDSLVALFSEASDALNCAKTIQEELLSEAHQKPEVLFRMGLSTSQPVTENGNFLQEAIRFSHRLAHAAKKNQLLIDSLTGKLCIREIGELIRARLMNRREETFLSEVFDVMEGNLASEEFGVQSLCKSVGVSSPQLYRRITGITGRSPNEFLRDIRMERARALLRQKAGNITQVAMEVGYNNPSYFAKCFKEKYGFSPSVVK
ncbi:nickel-binding protein [Negadavirga shengliensis]|uniref:Nickel-binding protein n=1 Tax=Negadavirga shengliensis TaxID=1389218 RepID=A0ABV9T7T5_9BACT